MKTNKKTEQSGVSEGAYASGSGRYAGTKTRLVVIDPAKTAACAKVYA